MTTPDDRVAAGDDHAADAWKTAADAAIATLAERGDAFTAADVWAALELASGETTQDGRALGGRIRAAVAAGVIVSVGLTRASDRRSGSPTTLWQAPQAAQAEAALDDVSDLAEQVDTLAADADSVRCAWADSLEALADVPTILADLTADGLAAVLPAGANQVGGRARVELRRAAADLRAGRLPR